MPRKWSNSHGGGGVLLKHHFVWPDTPVTTANYRRVDEILAHNAKIAGVEKRNEKRQRQRR